MREVVHCFSVSHFRGKMFFQFEYVVGSLCWVDFRMIMSTRSTFLAEEYNKTWTNDVSLNLFIKNE